MMPLDLSQSTFYFVSEDKLQEFIDYRKEIKKPIKTQRALNLALKQALECQNKLGIPAERAFDITMDNEWQGVRLEYIRNHLKSTGELTHVATPGTQPARLSLKQQIRNNQH